MAVDERIEDFGYELVNHNNITGIFTYENQTMLTGLSFEECRAFLDKADEIRNSMK